MGELLPTYPMHEKLTAIADQSQAIHDFLEWMGEEHGALLCIVPPEYDHTYVPMQLSLRKLLADFFEIDLDVIEAEKRAMLDHIRWVNESRAVGVIVNDREARIVNGKT